MAVHPLTGNVYISVTNDSTFNKIYVYEVPSFRPPGQILAPLPSPPPPAIVTPVSTVTYALTSGTVLPAGLTLDTSTGVISGTPTTLGAASVSFQATDGTTTVTSTFTMNITAPTPVVTAPTIPALTVGAAMTPTILPNITNNVGDAVTYALTGLPTGLLFDTSTLTLSGTPAAGTANSYSITYSATDTGGTGQAMFSLLVNAAYTAPPAKLTWTATANNLVTPYNTALSSQSFPTPSGGSSSNYTYTLFDSDNLQVTSNTSALSGTFQLIYGTLTTSDATFTYTPNTGFDGIESFTYQIIDTNHPSNNILSETFNIGVGSPTFYYAAAYGNDATTTLPTTLPIINGGTAPYTYSITGTSSGSLESNSATSGTFTASDITNSIYNLIYSAANGFQGTDVFTLTVTDSSETPKTFTENISITITPPTYSYSSFYSATSIGNDLGITLPTITGSSGTYNYTIAPQSVSTTGTLTMNSSSTGAGITSENLIAHNLIYTPAAGFYGADGFTITVTDANNASKTFVEYLNVKVPAPILSFSGTNLFRTLMTTELNSQALPTVAGGSGSYTYTKNSDPSHGSLSISGSTFTFNPTFGYTGNDSFTYTATDTSTPTPVSATNTIYIAVGELLTLASNIFTPGIITYNPTTPAPIQSLTPALSSLGVPGYTTSVSSGTLSYDPDANQFTYTPATGLSGSQTVGYSITDSANQAASGSFILRINNTQSVLDASTNSAPSNSAIQSSFNITSTNGTNNISLTAPIVYGNIDSNIDNVIISDSTVLNGKNTNTGHTIVGIDGSLTISRADNIPNDIILTQNSKLNVTKSLKLKGTIYLGTALG